VSSGLRRKVARQRAGSVKLALQVSQGDMEPRPVQRADEGRIMGASRWAGFITGTRGGLPETALAAIASEGRCE